jgi:hypothetical protein
MVREKKKKKRLTMRPALVQTAWRSSARAAGWMRPKVDFTEHSPGAPHHGASTSELTHT